MEKYTPYGVILTNTGGYTQYGVYTNVMYNSQKELNLKDEKYYKTYL